ncbi:MAG TPA: hypothetical protein VK524_13515 [Polyangiaceae bacterium]|nr:hypothetical protein [Polyangiaceae bacterium]
MCAGMLVMTHVDAVFYGQRVVRSKRVFERLRLDSSQTGGPCPYAFAITAAEAPTEFVARLSRAARSIDGKRERFALSEQARVIFAEAMTKLREFKPQYARNSRPLRDAQRFLESVPDHTPSAEESSACPGRKSVAAEAPDDARR